MDQNPLVEYMRTTTALDPSATEFLWRDAGSKLVLTAPHNKAVFRDGEYKQRDTNVGIIALEAAKLAGASALLPLTPGDADGNWHDDSRFRRVLSSLLEPTSVVIDVHGMTDAHGPDIILGTAGARSPEWLCAAVAEVFEHAGFVVEARASGPLSAGGRTLTSGLLEAGHAAIQIEIARRWRVLSEGPGAMTHLIDALAAASRAVTIAASS